MGKYVLVPVHGMCGCWCRTVVLSCLPPLAGRTRTGGLGSGRRGGGGAEQSRTRQASLVDKIRAAMGHVTCINRRVQK